MSFDRVRRARTDLVLIVTLGLVVALAIPATAQTEGGTGIAVGNETIDAESQDPAPPLCAEVFSSSYDLRATGTYTGLPDAVYSGSFDLTMTSDHSDGNYYIAPEGTYGERNADGTCDPATLGALDPVPANFTVYEPGSIEDANGEPCDGSGTFYRVNTTFVAEWELEEDCEVEGNVSPTTNQGTAPAGTTHTFEGNLAPCTPFACPDPQLEGTYQQTLH